MLTRAAGLPVDRVWWIMCLCAGLLPDNVSSSLVTAARSLVCDPSQPPHVAWAQRALRQGLPPTLPSREVCVLNK